MHRTRHHWLFTAAAVVLLLFTAGDLAYPAMCGEEGDVGAFAAVQMSPTLSSASHAGNAADAAADDCFCCCGHVLAGAVFSVAVPHGVELRRTSPSLQQAAFAPLVTFPPPKAA